MKTLNRIISRLPNVEIVEVDSLYGTVRFKWGGILYRCNEALFVEEATGGLLKRTDTAQLISLLLSK